MNSFIDWLDPAWIALAFGVATFGAWSLGWWQGRITTPDPSTDPAIKFTDAALALLGLLLAFTFSMSLAHHDQRRSMVVAESNAVGDFYTCASLLREPHRVRLQAVIREYAEQKLAAASIRSEADLQEKLRWFQTMHGRMTAVVGEALVDGTPIAVPLTNTLNEVSGSHASRLAAHRERLPWSIVLLLFLGAVIPAFLMGQQQAASARPHLKGTLCFIVMVSLVTYVTLDLNQPGRGVINVSQEPFERLLQSMEK
jgi:hypothetical protein